MHKPQSSLDKTRWLPYRNDASEEAPAFGVLEITGVTLIDGVVTYTVTKPTGSTTRAFMYNGPLVTPAGSYGSGSFDSPGLVACNSTPVAGETRGPVSGSWLLQTSGSPKVTVIAPAGFGNVASVFWPPVASPSAQPICGYLLSDSKNLTSSTADEVEFDSGSYPSPLSGDLYNDYLRVRSGHPEHLEQLAAGQRYLVLVTTKATNGASPLSGGAYCTLRTWLSMNLLNTPDDAGSWTSTGGPLESHIAFNPTVTNNDPHVATFSFMTHASATHYRFMVEAFSSTSINVTCQVAAHWIPVET